MTDPDFPPLFVPASMFGERLGVPVDFVRHAVERGALDGFVDIAGGVHVSAYEIAKAGINANIQREHDQIVSATMARLIHTTLNDANGQPLQPAEFDVRLRELTNRSLASHGLLLQEDRDELRRVRGILAVERREKEQREGI